MPASPRGQVVLVRHGETDWSRAGLHTGRTDIPLNDAGRRQAMALHERLAGLGFTRVLTSPLSRATETCELAGLADQAETLDDLQEWDYGAYEGLTSRQVRAGRPHWSLWADGVPEGETLAEVSARADRVTALVRGADAAPGDAAPGDAAPGDAAPGDAAPGDAAPGDAAPAGDVAVFAHGHLLRVLAARWLGLDPTAGRYLSLYAGSLSTLGWEHAQPVVVTWNDVAHLSPAGRGSGLLADG